MNSSVSKRYIIITTILVLLVGIVQAKPKIPEQVLKVSLQKRIPSDLDEGAFIIINEIQDWSGEETAVIICDMWDEHWCKGATSRVAEMAPLMNNVVSMARDKGALIVHAPSDCMDYYKNHPGRKLAKKYKSKAVEKKLGEGKLTCEPDQEWPFKLIADGCDDSPVCKNRKAWTKQIDTIEILEGDVITDSGVEAESLFMKRGIKNVILLGVHTNMCVIGRSFGLRNMTRLGMNVVLMRDLTDTMYDAKSYPYVSHFTGNSLMHEYIEKFVCPTIVSIDFTDKKQFRFKNDKRPVIAFIVAEGEYRANQRLPEFAHELLLTKSVNCEFALGKPAMKGEGRNNIENLQILNDADLAVFFIRRRALEAEKMALIQSYVYSGRPILGIRTASHAFDTKGKIPRDKESNTSTDAKQSEFLSSWPEFDKEILGGNYAGHYRKIQEGAEVSIVPGMQNNSLLKGVDPGGFLSPNWMYKNSPLRSDHVQVLLLGTIPNMPCEPVLWINQNKYGKAIYTSLGHWDDWKIESFKNIMLNSVEYLLKQHTK
jgi:nicotinamidase-related amidase